MNTTDNILLRATVYVVVLQPTGVTVWLQRPRFYFPRMRNRGETVMAAAEKPTKEKLLSTLDDIEVLSRFGFIYSVYLDENNFDVVSVCFFSWYKTEIHYILNCWFIHKISCDFVLTFAGFGSNK